MDSVLEKMKNFFILVFEKIGMFFKKIVEKFNEFRIFVVSACKKLFEKIKLKKEEFLKKRAIKKEAENAARQVRKEEKLKAKQEKEQKRQEEAAQRSVYLKSAGTRIFRGFLNIFDVLFDVVFSCGLIFCIRPGLLNFRNNESYSDFFDSTFDSVRLFLFGSVSIESDEVSNLTIFIIVCIFAVYLLYKVVFSLATANGVNKLISILLTMITLVSVTLVKDKLLIFLALYILIFATFQFSCGFDFKVCRIKFITFVCLAFVAYIVVLCVFDRTFRGLAIPLVKEMRLPISWL